MTKVYLSCTETAKLLRQALKESFPGQKFSVTSSTYSGGASIRVRWTDGPSSKDVDAICNVFAGADFDGMQDLKTYRRSQLNGQDVHFGADFIFANRDMSPAAELATEQAWNALSVSEQCTMFNTYGIRWEGKQPKINELGLRQFANLAASKMFPPKPSKLVASVASQA